MSNGFLPRLRIIDSNPSGAAIFACQSSLPNGCCRFTQIRSVISLLTEQRLINPFQHSFGTSTGNESLTCENQRLDHSQSTACSNRTEGDGGRVFAYSVVGGYATHVRLVPT